MKIKLVLYDTDERYVSRFFDYFKYRYSDTVDVHVYNIFPLFKKFLEVNQVDVLLTKEVVPDNLFLCTPIHIKLIEKNILTLEQTCIFKYQKMSHIYKDILNIYSDLYNVKKIHSSPTFSSEVISYFSLGSGEGSSTVAISHAKYLSSKNNKVLYLDLKLLPNQKVYFANEDKYTLSDVIYNLKINKGDIYGKIMSAISENSDGISYISPCITLLDRMEMGHEDIKTILDLLLENGEFQYIILNCDFNVDKERKTIFDLSSHIVFTLDGNKGNRLKCDTVLKAMDILYQENYQDIIKKIRLIYNKYEKTKADGIDNTNGMSLVGYLPKINSNNDRDIIMQLSKDMEGIKWG